MCPLSNIEQNLSMQRIQNFKHLVTMTKNQMLLSEAETELCMLELSVLLSKLVMEYKMLHVIRRNFNLLRVLYTHISTYSTL